MKLITSFPVILAAVTAIRSTAEESTKETRSGESLSSVLSDYGSYETEYNNELDDVKIAETRHDKIDSEDHVKEVSKNFSSHKQTKGTTEYLKTEDLDIFFPILYKKNSGSTSIENRSDVHLEFESMRNRWVNDIVGDLEGHPELQTDKDIANYVTQLSNKALELYESIDRHINRTTLWKKGSDTNSAHITTQFKKLYTLAIAYKTLGTELYNKNDVLSTIISGLDFMTAEGRYSGSKYFGNWWDWQIGVPQNFCPTLLILYKELEHKKITEYTTVISKYIPDPYRQLLGRNQFPPVNLYFIPNHKTSGANRIDLALGTLGLGLLTHNFNKINESVKSIHKVFEFVTRGDGFYSDGSFVQHNNIPYTGTYGNILIQGVGNIISIVAGTTLQVDDKKKNEFVEMVKNAFVPLIVNGVTMSIVNGRSITRNDAKNSESLQTMFNLLIISNLADNETKQVLRQAVKYWMAISSDEYYKSIRDFKDLIMTKSLLADNSIDVETKPFLGSRLYSSMDRFVFSDNHNITLGIAMYSNRIASFEAFNNENKQGWHTADGMVYLYNTDPQFGAEYWPTVDWYRLPGTTVDTQAMSNEINFVSTERYISYESYVGGASEKRDAVVSMQLNKAGTVNNGKVIEMDLTAKKSWFIFDGKIISLGTDINSVTHNNIETIIENRLLDPSSTYRFLNQNDEDVDTKHTQEVGPFDWFLLKSSKEHQSIGYVMLDNQIISTKKEKRSGTYQDINDCFPGENTTFTGTYQTIIIQHGKQISDGKYAYLTYPNANLSVLKSFVKYQRFIVLANNKGIQAVKDNKANKIGATIWDPTGGSVGGLTVNKAATLLYSEDTPNQVTLSVSDPEQNDKILEIQLPRKIIEILIVSQTSQVQLKDDRTVVVDTRGSFGKTIQVTAKISPLGNSDDNSLLSNQTRTS